MSKPCKKCESTRRNKRGECLDCRAAYGKLYYAVNKERLDSINAAYRASNPDKVREVSKKYRAANKLKIKEYGRLYRLTTKEACRIKKQNRRKNTSGKLSKDLPQRLLALQQGKCACCGASLEDGYHLDHIIPIALGGPHADDNIQLLTPQCNLLKGARYITP